MSSDPAAPQEGSEKFPESLEGRSSGQVVMETFGFQPLIWGLLLVLASLALARLEKTLDAETVLMLSTLAAAGLLLIAFEGIRRRRPTALLFQGDRAGVYRKGRLDMIVDRSAIQPYVLQGTNTVKLFFFMTMWVALFVMLALMATRLLERILAGAVAAAFCASMASLVCTRMLRRYYLVPKRSGRMELVLLKRDLIK